MKQFHFPAKIKMALFATAFLLILQFFAFNINAQMRQMYVSNIPSNTAQKLSFYSPNEGYIAFANFIGYTTDSGRTYTQKIIQSVNNNGYPILPIIGFDIIGVKAFNKSTYLVYGDYNVVPSILLTTDGGLSYKVVYYNSYAFSIVNTIRDMVFPQNNSVGYAVDFDGIIKTVDGGQTWNRAYILQSGNFNAIEAVDNNNVMVMSNISAPYNLTNIFSSNTLLKTSDGASWQTVKLPIGSLNYAFFLTPTIGWVNVSSGVYKTINGGVTWALLNDLSNAGFSCAKMKFSDSNTGYAIDFGDFNVFKTLDGGAIWEPLPRDNNFSYLGYPNYDLQLINASQFWTCGGYGFVQMSTNAGGTPLPKAYFKIDTTGVEATGKVNLTNLSRKIYSYKWFVNDTLVSTSYNANYSHYYYKTVDTITLVVSNGVYSDTSTSYQSFNYFPTPKISSFSPKMGGAGFLITINGNHFSAATNVQFGGYAAQSFNVISDTQITARVANGSTGNVTVTTPNGTDSLSGFVFVPPPIVSTFSPTSGTNGTVITITGLNFLGVTSVTFGGISAATFSVLSPTSITATIGSGASGDVVVNTIYGWGFLSGFKYYNLNPAITNLSPDFGGKGDTIRITGINLAGATSVNFGGTPAASFKVDSSSQITAILGSGSSGTVSVTTPYGTSSTAPFTYKYPPAITSFTPIIGGNGSIITINGSGFENNGTSVSFGGIPATTVNWISPNQITAIVSTGTTGDIVVSTLWGLASSPGFIWQPAPIILSFSPVTGSAGNSITIYGKNFKNLSNVSFGGAPATSYNLLSDTSISAIVGLGASGDVTVTTAGGNSSKGGFVYIPSLVPTISTVEPISAAIGANIKITGSNFNSNFQENTVYFGSIKAKIVSGTASQLNVIVPGGATYEPITISNKYLSSTYSKKFLTLFNGGEFLTDSTFEKKIDSTGQCLNYVYVNDLNGDNKLDVIVSGANGISVLRNTSQNNGKVSFAQRQDFAPTIFDKQAAIADFDGDGKPDIAITGNSYTGKNLIILRNISTINEIKFDTLIYFDYSDLDGGFVSAADFDGDGKIDIIVSDYQYGRISFYKNTSIGSSIKFETPINFQTNNALGKTSISDIDGDGKPDIIVAYQSTASGDPTFGVLRNTSNGGIISFDNVVSFKGGDGLRDITTGDLDGDGKLDIVTAGFKNISVLLNQSNPGKIVLSSKIDLPINGDFSLGVAVNDLNGDGKPDIVAGEYWFVDSVAVFQNLSSPGNIKFSNKIDYAVSQFPEGVTTGDVDGDGKPDILVINNTSSSPPSKVSILKSLSGNKYVQACTGSNLVIDANLNANNYQWQQDFGQGFVDINDSNSLTGTKSNTLQIKNITNVQNGNQFRCICDGLVSNTMVIQVSSNSIHTSVIVDTISSSICLGNKVTLTAKTFNGGSSPTYQWQVNNLNTGTNSPTFSSSTLQNNDQVRVIMTSSLSCASPATDTSNVITMTVVPAPQANAGNDVSICTGGNTQLSGSGGTTYSWLPTTGLSNPNIANPIASPATTTTYYLTVSNGGSCSATDTVVVTVAQSSAPSVKITSILDSICLGNVASFTATPTNGGTNPSYQWQVNNLNTGTNSNSFTSNTLKNKDLVKVVLTSNSTCATTPTATSNIITMNVQDLAIPAITVSNKVFTVTNPDAAATYTWQSLTNNVWSNIVPLATGTSYTAPANGSYRVMAVKGLCVDSSMAVVAGVQRNMPSTNPYGIYIYPNPTNSKITLDSIRLTQNWQYVKVFNLDGKLMMPVINIANKSAVSIDVSNLNNGTYFVELLKNDGEHTTLMFVKL